MVVCMLSIEDNTLTLIMIVCYLRQMNIHFGHDGVLSIEENMLIW